MCDNVSEALDRAAVWCILPKRNMRTPPIIIGGEFRKDPPQVLFVEHDQMIGTLAPDRPDQAVRSSLQISICRVSAYIANLLVFGAAKTFPIDLSQISAENGKSALGH